MRRQMSQSIKIAGSAYFPILDKTLDVGGGNPFMDEQLPHAVITLKQGVGRLIRDINDRGVLVLCDPRLVKKSYIVYIHTKCLYNALICDL